MSKESIPVTIPFTLEVKTPVSIGNGQKVTVLDYILDSSNQDVYILNQKKWFQYLDSIDKLFLSYLPATESYLGKIYVVIISLDGNITSDTDIL